MTSPQPPEPSDEIGAPPAPGPGWGWQEICASEALRDGGDGVRFTVPVPGAEPAPAFVVRFAGLPRAYLNRCSHVPVELDWQEGRFFDDTGLYLVCSTHGAHYRAADGGCVGGPCRGRPLASLQACEAGGKIWVAIRIGEA